MVEMAVRENDGVNFHRVLRQVVIEARRFVARALVHAKIEEEAQAVDLKQVAGAGDGAVRAAELDAHAASLMAAVPGRNGRNARVTTLKPWRLRTESPRC